MQAGESTLPPNKAVMARSVLFSALQTSNSSGGVTDEIDIRVSRDGCSVELRPTSNGTHVIVCSEALVGDSGRDGIVAGGPSNV